jgi:hypothetical protein
MLTYLQEIDQDKKGFLKERKTEMEKKDDFVVVLHIKHIHFYSRKEAHKRKEALQKLGVPCNVFQYKVQPRKHEQRWKLDNEDTRPDIVLIREWQGHPEGTMGKLVSMLPVAGIYPDSWHVEINGAEYTLTATEFRTIERGN